MLRYSSLLVLTLGFVACKGSWNVQDADGDGYTPLDGDCWDSPEGPGINGLDGADIHPSAIESWYDGFDQDCGGDDDYDQDGDGYVPDAYQGLATSNIEGSGQLPAGDCWDDPAVIPEGQRVVSSSLTDREGTQLNWEQTTAFDTYPAAVEIWYDGADSDCAGDSDFDQDLDGYASDAYPSRSGTFGEDCIDGATLDADNPAGIDAADAHPDADEIWYDGTDQDCDDNDCDSDGDGYDADPDDAGFCDNDDCDDEDPELYPDPTTPEIWYNGVDENCDNNDGDQDGDDYWIEGYEELVAKAGGTPMDVPSGYEGDCDDEERAVFPGATEVWYDGVDSDCAGDDDYDQDVDGYQSDAYGGTDCDDTNADVNPDALDTWYDGVDSDCGGEDDYDQDSDGHQSDAYGGDDCDDTSADVNPDATETWYDGIDSDCAGDDDYDADADGYQSDAYKGDDCDDSDAAVNPGATETWYDGVDADCAGDDDYDQDVDGYQSDAYGGDDCDDTDGAINPGATESYYDGVDANCDGQSDYDADADGYDSDAYSGADCDDADAAVNPGATETWYDGVDADCAGDDDYDQDADGYQSDAYGGDDCDDTEAAAYPGATETWYDGIDSDCDGASDYDQDGDGYDSDGYKGDDCDDSDDTINPGATEIWYDGVDQDCDGGSDNDQDGDGYWAESMGGSDCDDTDAGVNVGETDDGSDPLVDNDCDGYVDEASITAGSVVITEIAKFSTAGSGSSSTLNYDSHWFELYNPTGSDISLDDWHVRVCEEPRSGSGGEFPGNNPTFSECDAEYFFAVSPDAGIVISAGDYLVVCEDDTLFDDPTMCDYAWGDTITWTGSNPDGYAYSDETVQFYDQFGIIQVWLDTTPVDDVGWWYDPGGDNWPYQKQRTIVLDTGSYDDELNDDPNYWCTSDNSIVWATATGNNNYGNPGQADPGCP